MQRHKLAVQVGKCDGVAVKRAQLPYPAAGQHLNSLPADAADADIVAAALAEPKIAKLAEGMDLVKSSVVRGKLVSLIFKPKA